jgi:hypothetical protein
MIKRWRCKQCGNSSSQCTTFSDTIPLSSYCNLPNMNIIAEWIEDGDEDTCRFVKWNKSG